MLELEVWVIVDQGGGYEVAKEADGLGEQYEEQIGSLQDAATRRIKITIHVPKPQPLHLIATVLDEPSTGVVKAAEEFAKPA